MRRVVHSPDRSGRTELGRDERTPRRRGLANFGHLHPTHLYVDGSARRENRRDALAADHHLPLPPPRGNGRLARPVKVARQTHRGSATALRAGSTARGSELRRAESAQLAAGSLFWLPLLRQFLGFGNLFPRHALRQNAWPRSGGAIAPRRRQIQPHVGVDAVLRRPPPPSSIMSRLR